MRTTQRLICRWCSHTATRTYWVEATQTPVNPYLILRMHIQDSHPAEFQRIEDYLAKEVIVQSEQ